MKQLPTKEKMVYRIWPLLAFWEVPAYLEQMEKKGLRFERMCRWSLFAVFSRVLPENIEMLPEASRQVEGAEPVAYCWDYFSSHTMTEIEDYLEICRGGGWEIVWQFGKHKIFRRIDGSNPVPLQEEEVFQKSFRKRAALDLLLRSLLPLLGILFLWLGPLLSWDIFEFNFAVMFQFGQACVVTGLLYLIIDALWYLWKGLEGASAACGKKGILHTTPVAGALIRAALRLLKDCLGFLSVIFLFAMLVVEQTSIPFIWIIYFYIVNAPRSDPQQLTWEGANLEDYPEDQQMKGTYPRRSMKEKWIGVILIVIIVALCLGVLYGASKQQSAKISSKNLYCNEIYTDTRGSNFHNTYYYVRNERDVQKIVKGIFAGEWVKRDEEAKTAIKKGDDERLFAVVTDEGMREFLGSKPWEELYDGGAFCLIVRRGNEVWRVFNFVEPDSLEPMEFLQKTGF